MLPTDQRVDDARSLTFDSAPLTEKMELLGAAVVQLELAVDKPVAFLMVRLNEVEPEGVSKRLTYGVLNLSHRNGHEFPEPLEPGRRYRIRIQLQDCAQVLKAGNRIRVACSTTHWPLIWPSPEPVTLTLYAGSSKLELPVRPLRAADATLKPFGSALVAQNSEKAAFRATKSESEEVFEWNLEYEKLTLRKEFNNSYLIEATGEEISHAMREVSEIRENDPTSARVEYRTIFKRKRDNWDTQCESILHMSCTKEEFFLTTHVNAYENEREILTKVWNWKIPRQLV
jgi:hypothetical protein